MGYTVYDTTSILPTPEVRFGLPPLTQGDAAVADLRNAFGKQGPAAPVSGNQRCWNPEFRPGLGQPLVQCLKDAAVFRSNG